MNRKSMDIGEAAEGYLEAMRLNGVDYIFGSPGSDDAPYWRYIEQRQQEGLGPAYVGCRHEELSVDMAKGYATVTGKPQAVKLHVTVGPLKAAMSLWGAYHASIPLVVLSSHLTTHENELAGGTAGPHYLDFAHPGGHENNFSRYTKWGITPETNKNIGEYFARAFRIANTHPKGPVYLNIARELTFEERSQMEILSREPPSPYAPPPDTIAEIASRLEAATQPLFILGRVGTSVERIKSTVPKLVELAESVGAGVFEGFKWHFNYPMDHPTYLGSSHTGIHNTIDEYPFDDVDLVFVIDSERPWYPPTAGAPEADVLMLDREAPRPKQLYWNYDAETMVTGVPSQVIPELAAAVDQSKNVDSTPWAAIHDNWHQQWQSRVQAGTDRSPVDPFWLVDQLDQLIPSDAILVNETVSHASVVTNLLTDGDDHDRLFLSAEKLSAGGLGSGLGVALGAKLAEPDRTAVALVGDGAFNYNPVQAAFGAAQEHDLPILVVLFDNNGYQVMNPAYDEYYDGESAYGTDIEPKPDYSSLVTAWDVHGATVESSTEVRAAIEEGLRVVQEENRSVLLDVILPDRSVSFPAYE